MSNRFETSETLPQYFKEISDVAIFLSKEEEHDLAFKIQEGDDQALVRLISPNLKYVVTMANRFIGLGLPIDDLIQEGNLALIDAAKRYVPSRDTKFLTYAKFWIRKRLNLALCEYGRTVKLPVNQEYQIYKDKMKGESPNLSNVRIDRKVGEDGDVSLGDLVLKQEFADPFENQEKNRIIAVTMSVLKPNEKRIIELFYGFTNEGDDLSIKDVAEIVGRTPAEVNRTLKVARSKMRKIAVR